MPISNAEAYQLKQQGRSVIVVCAECGEQVWTANAMYLEMADEWYCEDCDEDLMEEVTTP